MTGAGPARRTPHRGALAALVAALAVVGCAVAPGGNGPIDPRAFSETLSGSYLAARFAGGQREDDAAAAFYAEALRRDPDNPVLIERAFIFEVASGDVGRAAVHARRLVTFEATHRLGRLVLAVAALKARNCDEVRGHLGAAASAPFHAVAANLIDAWCLQSEGRLGEAIAKADELTAQTGAGLLARLHIGFMQDAAGNSAAALEAFLAANEQGEGRIARLAVFAGAALERAGRGSEARAVYDTALQANPLHPMLRAARARVEAGGPPPPRFVTNAAEGAGETLFDIASSVAGERGGGLATLYLRIALYLRPDSDEAKVLLADLYRQDSRWEDAAQLFAEVRRTSPLWTEARIALAQSLARGDREDDALAVLDAELAAQPGERDLLIARGDLMRQLERWAEAAETYGRVIDAITQPAPQDWAVFYARGIALERSKRWPEAEADLEIALALNPEQPYVMNYLAYTWIDQGVRLDEATDMIRRAVALRPQDGFIIDSLAWAYYRRGNYKKALEHMERAIALEPGDPTITDHYGDVLWKVGRRLEARFQWKQALTLDPEPEQIAAIRRKIEFGLDAVAGDAQGAAPAP